MRSTGYLFALLLIVTTDAALAEPPSFDPATFFTGRTHGKGCLKVLLSRCRPITVASSGSVASDGTLIVDQDVTEGAKPPRHRQWSLKQTAPNRYTGILSDALGPVDAMVSGNVMTLSFTMKRGLHATQTLTLTPDGTRVDNAMKIRKMGMVVATLNEVIEKE